MKAINENKPENTTQIKLPVQKEDIDVVLASMFNKLENITTIKTEEKHTLKYRISNKIQKLEEKKVNLQEVTKNIQDIINSNKITKGKLTDLEDELDNLIEQQAVVDNRICKEKLDIFQQTATKVITKLALLHGSVFPSLRAGIVAWIDSTPVIPRLDRHCCVALKKCRMSFLRKQESRKKLKISKII